MPLTVGVHPNNLHLQIAALEWPQDSLPGVRFVHYPEGRNTAQLLQSGTIEIGGTGSTPPLIAQAAGTPVRYLAASTPRVAHSALVTRAASGLHSPQGLRGKRVALLDGSFHTPFLAAVLEKAGLDLRDVLRVELSPQDAYYAMQTGEVDAWIAMAPWLERLRAEAGWTEISTVGDFLPNRSLFWTLHAVHAAKREVLTQFLAELIALGQRIHSNTAHYAELLARAGVGGFDAPAWARSLAQRDWHLVALTGDTHQAVGQEQQQEADLLWRHKALPQRISIAEALPSL